MKKILFIHASLGGGGAERVLIDLLKNFDYTRYQIDLLLIYGRGVYLNTLPKNVNYLGCIYDENYKRSLFEKTLVKFKFRDFFSKSDINRIPLGNYDIIVSFMESLPLKFHHMIKEKSKINITWVHSDIGTWHWSKDSFRNYEDELRSYDSMDSIVFVSKEIKYNFNQKFVVDKNKQHVIYNPIDKSRIIELSKETIDLDNDNRFKLIAIGRLAPIKRYDRLFEAIRILLDRNVPIKLDVLGYGPEEENLKRMINELAISQAVRLLGYSSNPYPYLKDSDLLVMTSDKEGLPTVILESFLLGVPVVATNVPGCSELLDNSKYGLLTNCTPIDVANAIENMYKDKSLYNMYKANVFERAKTISLENSLNQIYNLL